MQRFLAPLITAAITLASLGLTAPAQASPCSLPGQVGTTCPGDAGGRAVYQAYDAGCDAYRDAFGYDLTYEIAC